MRGACSAPHAPGCRARRVCATCIGNLIMRLALLNKHKRPQAGCGVPGFAALRSGAECDGVPCVTDTAIIQLCRAPAPSSTAPDAHFHSSILYAKTNSALPADGGAGVLACKVG